MKHLALFALLSLTLPTSVLAQANDPKNEVRLTTELGNEGKDLKISLPKTEMKLSEILKELHRKYLLNFVVEDYSCEFFRREIKADSLTVPQLMQLIATTYKQKIVFANGIYVLRYPGWAQQVRYREEIATGKRPVQPVDRWPDAGSIVVERHDDPENPDLPLPAKDISVRAERISVVNFMDKLRAKSLWNVRTDPTLKERRLTVFVSHVAPGKLIEDIGYLLNAGSEITLRPTELNVALLEDEQSELPEDWRQRKRLSDKIKADLEKLLTPEDKEKIAQGEFVAIPIHKMPKELQGRALDYLNQCFTMMGADMLSLPDASRSKNFAVEFKPLKSGLAHEVLGAMVIGPDGTEYYF